MKQVFQHPEPSHAEKTGPRYWRSLDELQNAPAFREYLDREFPEGASELSGVDRRNFFKIMAASFAFGGLTLTGCRRPERKILPYAKTPENIIPGVPLYYATSFPLRKSAVPLVVETHGARPIKIEGNPSFKPHGGSTDLVTQASILDLYDPDRSTAHKKGGAPSTVAAVQAALADVGKKYAGNGGAGLAFLAGQSSSPTRARLVAELKAKLPSAVWAEYEPADGSNPEKAATKVYGTSAKLHYNFGAAARVVAVDADFISQEDGHLEFSRAFADGRRVETTEDPMNRLYAIESTLTLSGGMADHRLRLATGEMTAFLAQLARAVGVTGSSKIDELAAASPADAEWVKQCAEDLKHHRGESLVIAGNHLPEAAHAIAILINEALGNVGKTVLVLQTPDAEAASIADLAAKIRAGNVNTLVVLGGNPVYNAPADLDWKSLQSSVSEVIRLGYYEDESSEDVAWHVSEAHYLESWGDARTADGTIVPVQPMIMPLFKGLTEIEVLARILGDENPDPYQQVFKTLSPLVVAGRSAAFQSDAARGVIRGQVTQPADANPEPAFRKFLHDGLIEGSGYPQVAGGVDRAAAAALINEAPAPVSPSSTALEVRFLKDLKVDDGRFVNNGWLQECPDPITKLTWDNAIQISPRLAAELDVVAEDSALQIIRKNPNTFDRGRQMAKDAEITIGGRTVRGPVHIQPGLANYTVVLPLGYGRSKTGRIGTGSGFNAYSVRTSDSPAAAQGATIKIVPGKHRLASTQEHWSMEGRAIVREANLEDYVEHPDFVDQLGMESHTPSVLGADAGISNAEQATATPRGQSLYEHPDYDGTHQWAMSIDLTTCTGCNACVVACQAENNIPIVGRDEVLRGREMHWIRIDRYYADGKSEAAAFGGEGNAIVPEDPQVVVQPVGCFHCENATCESVCPVNATVHDDEGLNTMAYNRCIGTRYCANNCPYKVRRFNFFDYNQRALDQLYLGPAAPKGMPEIVQMVKNPDVTVRMRGVMEKCTYCVQRLQEAKIAAKVRARDSGDVMVRDGDVKTACQQVCPTEAIVFGNLLDPESRVSKAKKNERDYSLLGYLNTRPRTTFIARLRNPNPAMPDYHSMPLSRVEYETKNPHGDHHGGHGEGGDGHGETHEASESTHI